MTSPDSTRNASDADLGARYQSAMAASRDVAWAFLRSLGCSNEEADDLAQEAVLVLARKQPELDGDAFITVTVPPEGKSEDKDEDGK